MCNSSLLKKPVNITPGINAYIKKTIRGTFFSESQEYVNTTHVDGL